MKIHYNNAYAGSTGNPACGVRTSRLTRTFADVTCQKCQKQFPAALREVGGDRADEDNKSA